jgi:hypothetical protein
MQKDKEVVLGVNEDQEECPRDVTPLARRRWRELEDL